MARERYTAEEIIGHLRTIEMETGKGFGIAEVCRRFGITEETYWWKKEYGGWRCHYNTHRPHSALGYQPPAPETRTVTPIGLSA
jgi:Integrase core domain/Transposase